MKSIFYLMSLIFMSACSSSTGSKDSTWYDIEIEGDTLIFIGDMNRESLAFAEQLIKKFDVGRLRISSGGGDALESIAFGHFINDRDIDVVVSRVCFSSCANYVLPSAASVFVESGAVLGWHGGAESDYSHEPEVWSDSELNDWRVAERSLYEKTGTCWELSVYPQDSMSWYSAYIYDGWAWDMESLTKLGLENVTFEGGVLATKGKGLPSVARLGFKGPCKPYNNAVNYDG